MSNLLNPEVVSGERAEDRIRQMSRTWSRSFFPGGLIFKDRCPIVKTVRVMGEMVASTLEEPGTQGYEWFLSEDSKICHIRERYADSEVAMVHLGNFDSKFADRFLACFEATSLSVYGELCAEARAALDGFGATYLGSARWIQSLMSSKDA